MENTAKQNLQPQNILQGDSENISIHLEERNTTTEEGESSVNTKEEDLNLASMEGGSSVDTLTGTECNIVYVNNQEQDFNLACME